MNRRLVSILLVVVILASFFSFGVSARASYYFSSYSATLRQGVTGKINLNYTVVSCAGTMNTIGVSRIWVYKSDGTLYKTIYGSTANGLLKSNATAASGTYPITCVSGSTYYCIVKFYASNSSGSDSKTYQTTSITCP